jgi:methanogenic corrinoid protein MtbC1
VPPSKFVEKAREVDADVVGLSGLMTQDIDPAFKTVLELRRTGARTKTIVGGVFANKEMQERVGADAFGVNPWDGVEKARKLIGKG